MKIIELTDFDHLFNVLHEKGYSVIGPTVEDEAIVYEQIESSKDLPQGIGDEQAPGKYRLRKRDDQALFGYVVGPTSWKKYLFPPKQKLWSATKTESGFEVDLEEPAPSKKAFLGIRSCEIAAISIQDKVFMGGQFVDSTYKNNRQNNFFIAVNCTEPGGNCFCTSMDSGPKAQSGFDLSITEVIEADSHYFIITAGSDQGQEVLDALPAKDADQSHAQKEDALMETSKANMGRQMDTTNIKELLYNNLEHPRWDEVADRCMSCANCTMSCPTCFCSNVEDVTDLTGDHAERWRSWDSCFSKEFSYIHGGNVRKSTKSQYRQWMTHKLASWQDQFDSSGCVGCGRCVTWCPVGIDITEEVQAIRDNEPAGAKESKS